MLAETLLLASRPEEVFRLAEAVFPEAQGGKRRHLESELFRIQGEAARAMRDVSQAVSFYRRGIESARSIGARLLELRSLLALARLTGGAEERDELKSVLEGLTEGFEQADLKQAGAFLMAKDLGDRSARAIA